MNTYPRVYLTYHADGSVGIGTPPDASAPLGEPVEHLRVSLTDGVGSTQEKARNWTPIFTLQDIQDAILAEREACAKVAEEPYEFTSEESHRIAAAIRSRGEK